MNTLTRSIARIVRQYPLQEKWLLAPSQRIGYQWLEAVYRSSQALVNLRVKNLRSLAVEFALPALSQRGLEPLAGRAGVFLTGIVFKRLSREKGGYLLSLEPSPAVLERIFRAITELRLAGLTQEDLSPECFEVETKGREVKLILREYLAELRVRSLADYADILNYATEAVKGASCFEERDVLVLVPAELELAKLERSFLEAIPKKRLKILEVDRPRTASPAAGESFQDSELLAWLPNPELAPAPMQDGSVRIYRAVGEVNEVRQVIRFCLSQGIRFDDVELLHTDSSTYVPLVYEVFQALVPREKQTGTEGVPVTFAEGIPTRYSRPGKALSSWLAWIEAGMPQQALVRMLEDGLLVVPGAEEADLDFHTLASMLRKPGIGWGRERYLGKIDEWIASCEKSLQESVFARGEYEPVEVGRREDLAGMRVLRRLIEELLELSPSPEDTTDTELLECARRFLSRFARCVDELDSYARRALLDRLEEMLSWVSKEKFSLGIDLWRLLAGLPAEVPVLGSGPRPGKIHLANIASGGHSHRAVTFILGLDEGRFPGAWLQDPVLLDSERGRLSNRLPTQQQRLERELEGFSRLLARLRGRVILSYSSYNLADDREIFPSPVLLAAYRIISGEPEADLERMLSAVSPVVSFAPGEADSACSES